MPRACHSSIPDFSTIDYDGTRRVIYTVPAIVMVCVEADRHRLIRVWYLRVGADEAKIDRHRPEAGSSIAKRVSVPDSVEQTRSTGSSDGTTKYRNSSTMQRVAQYP
eukprot:3423245-Rhodomonas_salina.1